VAALQGLKLITAKRQTAINPVQFRRNKLSQRVQEQIALAQAAVEQRIYVKQRQRSVKDSSGIRNTITTQVRVKQWWWTQDNGKLALSIRYGSKIIALSPK
jgi:biotin carboxylase